MLEGPCGGLEGREHGFAGTREENLPHRSRVLSGAAWGVPAGARATTLFAQALRARTASTQRVVGREQLSVERSAGATARSGVMFRRCGS